MVIRRSTARERMTSHRVKLTVVLTIVIVLLLAGPGMAGYTSNLGVQAGPSWGGIRGDGMIGWKSDIGFRLGLALEWLPENGLGFESGLFFSQDRVHRQYIMEYGLTDYAVDERFTVNRLEVVPLMVKYYPATNGSVKPYVGAAPLVALNAQSEMNSNYYSNVLFGPGEQPGGTYANNKLDYGVVFDGGLGFRTQRGFFSVGAQYYLGLQKKIGGCVICGSDDDSGKLSSTRIYVKYSIRPKQQ